MELRYCARDVPNLPSHQHYTQCAVGIRKMYKYGVRNTSTLASTSEIDSNKSNTRILDSLNADPVLGNLYLGLWAVQLTFRRACCHAIKSESKEDSEVIYAGCLLDTQNRKDLVPSLCQKDL